MYFQWIQLKDAIPSAGKELVKQESNVNNDLLTLDHHVIKAERCLSIDSLTSKELHSIFLLKKKISYLF